MLQRLTTLHVALAISALLHGVLLTVRFVDPEGFNRIFNDTPLEVVLVNARSEEAPEKAQAIAQVQLNGGGEADQGRATSPLPPSPSAEVGDAADVSHQQIQQLQEQQQQLLAQIRREVAMLPPPDPKRAATDAKAAEQEEHRRQQLRLLAEIERRVNEENARPKKRYISPATREEVYALYYDSLRRKIEARGTRDFPEHNGRKLYGELTMNVTIDAKGRVVEAEVVAPSKSKLLDKRAVAIVRGAGPFGRFTDAMRKQTDQIVITSRFRFTRDEGFATTLTGQSN